MRYGCGCGVRAVACWAGVMVLVLMLAYFELELPSLRVGDLNHHHRLSVQQSQDGEVDTPPIDDDDVEEVEVEDDAPRPQYTTLHKPQPGEYSPLAKDTAARKIFQDRGVHLMDMALARRANASSLSHLNFLTDLPSDAARQTGTHLITTFFKGKYAKRRFSEIVASLVANLENPHIAYVHCLWELENPAFYLQDFAAHLLPKLVAVEVKEQPTYAQMFSYANAHLARGAVVIVTNADIYFDASIQCIVGPPPRSNHSTTPLLNTARAVYALSRRPTHLCGNKPDHRNVADLCEQYSHSHDGFVFAVPVPEPVIKRTHHVQNKYGGENIIIWEFAAVKIPVWNPCKRIHAIHLHCSEERHYSENFIDGYNGVGPYRHGIVYPGAVRFDNRRNSIQPRPFHPCGAPIL